MDKTKLAIKKLNKEAGIKPKKKKKQESILEVMLKNKKSIDDFLKRNPTFYDEHSLWWIWKNEKSFWEIGDNVDVLNSFIDYTGLSTEKVAGASSFLLKVIQQKSRKNKPDELPPFCIQFKDVIVNLKTSEEFKASSKFFSTSPIPYELSDDDSTPTIERLFREWVGEEWVETLFEVLGYSCLREQFLQTFVCLTGAGSNGKGTYQNLLVKFLGKENCVSSSIQSLITRSFETSALYKKLLCLIGEVDATDLKNTNLIKQLTGEDLIRYEFKGKTSFSEVSPTTFLIATNSLPRTPDKSDGFYRRTLVIDFPNQFKVQRDLLAQIPEKEFNNLARKVVNVLKNLLESNEFTNAGDIETKRIRYEERSNPLMMFISECYEETGNGFVRLREFANDFNVFLKGKKLRQETVSKIGKFLRDEGFEIQSRDYRDGNGVVIDKQKSVIGLSRIGENSSLGSLKTTVTTSSGYTRENVFCFRCHKSIQPDQNLIIKDRYYCPDCFKFKEGIK